MKLLWELEKSTNKLAGEGRRKHEPKQFNMPAAQTPAEGELISICVKPNDFNCIILKTIVLW